MIKTTVIVIIAIVFALSLDLWRRDRRRVKIFYYGCIGADDRNKGPIYIGPFTMTKETGFQLRPGDHWCTESAGFNLYVLMTEPGDRIVIPMVPQR